ncbi:uncharacterized protein BDZ99DRAFT_470487 [Mytilinidion resinicola]|uniref:Uncharacterized protein n=1 Tax=Mytilinidion resinicola TaxID=574789 RepID=A0A6A6Z8Z2_9PEZI|nr:uncharacterized protein BDZ99DRAFT_470487 [Mytilinidion resinicola]KAF2817490.1 hypothetical protein BDZ99DRAFT_470487 [Mytilinidion resinicola]
MCHFALHIWKCGDSFFTKYSSCSFDRAVHDTNSLLNPLHQSVRPHGRHLPCPPPSEPDLSPRTCHATPNTMSSTSSSRSSSNDTPRPCLAVPTIDLSSPGRSTYTIENNPSTCARDAKTGELIPIAMELIGKMSDINQNNLGESGKCYVFEVVLQRREPTICPFSRWCSMYSGSSWLLVVATHVDDRIRGSGFAERIERDVGTSEDGMLMPMILAWSSPPPGSDITNAVPVSLQRKVVRRS